MGKIHFPDEETGYMACGAFSFGQSTVRSTNDKDLVTCGACKRTRLYRGIPEKLPKWVGEQISKLGVLSNSEILERALESMADDGVYDWWSKIYVDELKRRLRDAGWLQG